MQPLELPASRFNPGGGPPLLPSVQAQQYKKALLRDILERRLFRVSSGLPERTWARLSCFVFVMFRNQSPSDQSARITPSPPVTITPRTTITPKTKCAELNALFADALAAAPAHHRGTVRAAVDGLRGLLHVPES